MRTKVHLRVAKQKGSRRPKVAANAQPTQAPLTDTAGRILPTTCFALELDIPDAAFESAARVVASLRVPPERLEIAAEVLETEGD